MFAPEGAHGGYGTWQLMMSEEGFPAEQNVYWLLPSDENAAISICLVCHPLHLCTSPRPTWSGMMQMVHTGDNPGQSSVLLLPMIDFDPGNMSCVHSTLKFICEHSARYNVTPIITFDQPLLWKSLQVIEGQPENSPLRSIVLRFDGFHTETSFIGSIGHLMSGSGLHELLETIYANNAVTHMLTGKAVQRAFSGLLQVDSSLSAMIVSDEFNVKATCIAPAQDTTEMEAESSTALPDQTVLEAETTRSGDTGETTPTDLEAVRNMFDEVLTGKVTAEEACMSQELTRIIERLEVKKQSIQVPSTAKLMMDILRMFPKGERMGILALRIQAMYDMMPYFAASGITCTRNAFMYTCSRCISFMKPIQMRPDTSTKGSTLYSDQIGCGWYFPLILSLSKSSCGA